MLEQYPVVLTIAGSDSSGGAGIQADIKAASANGAFVASVITALTAQNTQGVQAVEIVSADFVGKQLDSVFSDLTVNAIKTGMLANAEIITVIAEKLKHCASIPLIIDPVMVAQSGASLLDSDAVQTLKQHLLPLATLITPNIPEAEVLLGEKITSIAQMPIAAQQLAECYQTNILLKGGHLSGELAEDFFYSYAEQKLYKFSDKRIDTNNTHGTGCSLSAAIAAYLAQGQPLVTAVKQAKTYLQQAIIAGVNKQLGKGAGPVHHFWNKKDA